MPAKKSAAPSRKWQWVLLQFGRRLWVRAAVFALLAVATAFVAIVVKPYLPPNLGTEIGADAVDAILTIIASSMLTVSTFALGIVISAFAGASSNVTPRAARLLSEDTDTQNALASFLGAFLFAIAGIIALKTGVYGENGRLVLFVVTIAVIIVVFITFIRWIESMRSFGRMGDTLSRVERATTDSLAVRLQSPYLGGQRRDGPPPPGAMPLRAKATGYVQYIDIHFLSVRAESKQLEIHLGSQPGSFVHPSRPLAWISPPPEDESIVSELCEAFTIGDQRTYEQDPRFGITVLAEVASRALSPAVNDPGTAIEILGRAVRVLSAWADREEPELLYPRIHVAPLNAADFFEDFFRPIARDAASLVEVQIRLQKSLRCLATCGPVSFRIAAEKQSREALERAEAALSLDGDREVLRELAREISELPEPFPVEPKGI